MTDTPTNFPIKKTAKFSPLVEFIVEWSALIGVGALLGLLIAYLERRFGIKPQWFVATGAVAGIAFAVYLIWRYTREREVVFILDSVVVVELIIGITTVSGGGAIFVVCSIWQLPFVPLLLALITLVLIVAVLIRYLIANGPEVTWDD